MPQHQGNEDAVNLVVSLCLVYTLCIAGLRVWIRKGNFGSDDLVIAIATVVTLCSSAAGYVGISAGLGTKWSGIVSTSSVQRLDEAAILGVVTFIAGLYLSKCSMLSFLSRITKAPRQIKLFITCNVITGVIGIVSILVATVDCPSESGYYWAFHGNRSSCPSQSTRWQVITGLDVITEILLLALPAYLVWGLQMPLRKKAMIIAAFYLRLPVIGFSISRNYYTLQLRLPKTDPGLGSGLVVIFLNVELAYALAASTLSALKAFTESFNSCFGLGFTRGKSDGTYGMSNVSGSSGQSSKTEKSRKGSFPMDSARGESRAGSVGTSLQKGDADISISPLGPNAETIEEAPLKLRPETELRTFTHVSVEPSNFIEHPAFRGDSSISTHSHSDGGDDMGIVRETTFEVHDQAPMLSAGYHS